MGCLPTRINRAACLALVVLAILLFLQIFTYHRNAPKSVDDEPDVNKNVKDNQPAKKIIKPSPMSKADRIDFMKTQASVQSKRKATLRQTCERRGVAAEKDPPYFAQLYTLVVENYKAMYCIVPMIEPEDGSNLKRIMMVLNGKMDKENGLPSEEVDSRARLFRAYSPDQKQQFLKNYRKFFFVREPLQRILSVYRSKFENVDHYRGAKSFHAFGKHIITKFRKGPSAASVQTGENVTWPEFVDYLTHPKEEHAMLESTAPYSSNYWKAIHEICSPCTIDYDVIGKRDTINEDAQYVLNLIDAPSKVKYSSASGHQTNSSDKGTFEKYISQLSKKKLTQLWDRYKLDYELFGYPKPAIIPD